MEVKYDPALCERLIAEAQDPKAKCTACGGLGWTEHHGPVSGTWTEPCEPCGVTGLQAIANLSDIADQLEAAKAEIDHAVSENFAFNVKVSSEISGLRIELQAVTAERDALRAEVESTQAELARLKADLKLRLERLSPSPRIPDPDPCEAHGRTWCDCDKCPKPMSPERLAEIEALCRTVHQRNASVKFGDPRYVSTVNSKELLGLVTAIPRTCSPKSAASPPIFTSPRASRPSRPSRVRCA